MAYAQRSVTSNDELKLFSSINCCETWVPLSYSKSSTSLSTAGVVTSNFIQSNQNQRRQQTVFANSVQNQSNVRFKFQNTSNNGNNTYIDDINITGNIVGLQEAEELKTGFSLYPNPSEGESILKFELTQSAKVKIEVKNILGQTIYSLLDKTMDAGIHEKKLNDFNPGIYLADVTINGSHHIQKFIVY